MWRRSLRRPGLAGLPAPSHCSRRSAALPGARVVKPRISTLTPQRSRRAHRMSALIAATVIGRPRIEPELSISSDDRSVGRSCVLLLLEGEGMHRIGHDAGPGARRRACPRRGRSPGAVLLRHQAALQAVWPAKLADHALEMSRAAGRDTHCAGGRVPRRRTAGRHRRSSSNFTV